MGQREASLSSHIIFGYCFEDPKEVGRDITIAVASFSALSDSELASIEKHWAPGQTRDFFKGLRNPDSLVQKLKDLGGKLDDFPERAPMYGFNGRYDGNTWIPALRIVHATHKGMGEFRMFSYQSNEVCESISGRFIPKNGHIETTHRQQKPDVAAKWGPKILLARLKTPDLEAVCQAGMMIAPARTYALGFFRRPLSR